MMHGTSTSESEKQPIMNQPTAMNEPIVPLTRPQVRPPFPHGGSGVILSAALFREVDPEAVIECIRGWSFPPMVGR